MQAELWEWLRQRGYTVAGEVNLGNGQIDLVGKNGDSYVGYEIKTTSSSKLRGSVSPQEQQKLLRQLNRYKTSGYLNSLYFCCEFPEQVRSQIGPNKLAEKVGLISVSLDDQDITISEEAGVLERTKTPEFSRNNEAWAVHHVLRWADDGGMYPDSWTVATREGLLPGRQYIDVSQFIGSYKPTDIFCNQDDFAHIGFECKGINSITRIEKVKSQLERYLRSGGLTHLVLGVPQKVVDTMEEALFPELGQQPLMKDVPAESPITKVGLISVDTEGEVEVQRQPERVQMRYDGVEKGGKCLPIGWGERNDDLPGWAESNLMYVSSE